MAMYAGSFRSCSALATAFGYETYYHYMEYCHHTVIASDSMTEGDVETQAGPIIEQLLRAIPAVSDLRISYQKRIDNARPDHSCRSRN